MKKISHSHHGTLSHLNITPLLDLVFVLLVIFIITTPQMMNNLRMTLPSSKPPPPSHQPKPKIDKITVDTEGQTYLNGNLVTLPKLKEDLKAMKAADPKLGVVVKGADAVDYQHMISVLDILRQLGITKVGLATRAASP